MPKKLRAEMERRRQRSQGCFLVRANGGMFNGNFHSNRAHRRAALAQVALRIGVIGCLIPAIS